MTWLLDGNALVAMTLPGHAFFGRIHRWLAALATLDTIATCPITEGTLLRLHMQHARDKSPAAAWASIAAIHAHPRHRYWPENFSYQEIDPTRLTGHRQITDSWLAELARRKAGRLATLDEALHLLWPESTLLVPA